MTQMIDGARAYEVLGNYRKDIREATAECATGGAISGGGFRTRLRM